MALSNLRRQITEKWDEIRNSKQAVIDEHNEAAAELEDKVREFFETPTGKYLKERMINDKDQALKALAKINAYDAEAVMMAQNRYNLIILLEKYLKDALAMGQQAKIALDNKKHE